MLFFFFSIASTVSHRVTSLERGKGLGFGLETNTMGDTLLTRVARDTDIWPMALVRDFAPSVGPTCVISLF